MVGCIRERNLNSEASHVKHFQLFWHVYVLWLGVSPWKFSPTVKGSRCQGHSLTEIKTFLSIKVIRHNAITQCASGNAWADVSRSSIRFTYSSVAHHIGPCICHKSQTYTWNDVIPYKGRMIRVFCSFVVSKVPGIARYKILDIFSPKQSRVNERPSTGGFRIRLTRSKLPQLLCVGICQQLRFCPAGT